MMINLILSLIFYLSLLTTFTNANRRRRLLRVGVRPDPPLKPFTNTSNIYISYTNFLRGFINSQGLFNRNAPIPANRTYASFMDTTVMDGGIRDKNELSALMAHVLMTSKGLTQIKAKNSSIMDDLTETSYIKRGYLGIEGLESYEKASLALFKDLRLLKDPESIIKDESLNWKISLWNWKHRAIVNDNFCRMTESEKKSCEVVYQIYTILKKEWDPKSELYSKNK